jgi:hypothetical protein
MYYKSISTCLLSAALLLGNIVNSHRSATERQRRDPECRGVTDESGVMLVDCSWQGLVSVPAISPGQLVSMLDLSHSTLHKLHNDSFHRYPNLTQLILSSDSISSIEVDTFSSLKALRKVDLSYNGLTFIHPDVFIHNTRIETLSLQGNPLRPLQSGTPLLIATSLWSLDLSHCHILELSAESLAHLPELKILDLSHNRLRQLSINNMPALSLLQLAGNPWQCDCHFHALLTWVSADQVDSDVRTDNTVQCWQGEVLRNLTTKQEQDNICKNVTGHPISQKITPKLAVTVGKKYENTHSKEEGPELEIEMSLDDVASNYDEMDENSDLVFPALNKDDDVRKYDDEYLEVFSYDNEDSEENISSSAAEVPSSVQQDYTGLNLTLGVEVGDDSNEISREGELTNPTIDDFILEDTDVSYDDEFYDVYEDSEELDKDSISLLSAEIRSLGCQNGTGINSTVNMKAGDNHAEISRRAGVRGSTIKCPTLNDDFIPEDKEAGYYDYEFYGEYRDYSEEQKANVSRSSIETANVHDILENSDLRESDTRRETTLSTTGFLSQNNDSGIDGIASDNSSQRVSNSALTDSIKDGALNNSHNDGDNAVPSTKTPSIKHENEYEFAEPSIFLENTNSEGTGIKNDTIDYTIQFPSIYDDFNPEDTADPFVFLLDDLDSEEIVNDEISPSTTTSPNLIEEDNFDIDRLIEYVLKGFYSEADDQKYAISMNQINDKPPNRTNLKLFTVVRFLILAGVVSVVVFVLIVIIYFIRIVCLTPVLSRQMYIYKRMEKCASKDQLLQNV